MALTCKVVPQPGKCSDEPQKHGKGGKFQGLQIQVYDGGGYAEISEDYWMIVPKCPTTKIRKS
ncbi:hypothetical protein GSI_11438 [Ganoderma sinense ZZ0214-1]|uniref:Uncharacterized protein n=1 Tax=Ganoderma sinense ZZ0214-1 TaxID=1077348 RepID=A0A2G8RWI8_9APHY|nr:hypothetical protein GSI_11438 [Ganoderma sinense ZZ0214-1]